MRSVADKMRAIFSLDVTPLIVGVFGVALGSLVMALARKMPTIYDDVGLRRSLLTGTALWPGWAFVVWGMTLTFLLSYRSQTRSGRGIRMFSAGVLTIYAPVFIYSAFLPLLFVIGRSV